HPVCKYKGQAGAIRSIDAHPTAPYVATCGIDRFARVHDIDTKKLAHKVYCKTRLNRVLIRSELPSLLTVIEGNDEQEWMELKKEMNCDSDSATGSASDEDVSEDECTWEKLAVSDADQNLVKIRQRKHKKDGQVFEAAEEDEEPASKRRKITKSKKRKEEVVTDENDSEPRKKAKVVQGVKRQDEMKQEVDSDEEPPKRRRKSGRVAKIR
ncbi:hypothetical protein ANCDUO_03365, partial [Ancylostoma duodenale]